MTTIARGAFPRRRDDFPVRAGGDRNAFVIFVGLVWIGIISGFGFESFAHLRKHGLDYPIIVHVHALVFVGWMVLFSVQVALIRSGRRDLHRRLGMAGAVLFAMMVVLGPITSLIMDGLEYARDHKDTPEFLGAQLIDMFGIAVLTCTGLLLRKSPSAHKRLMLLGLFYISDAGFARLLNVPFATMVGNGFWGDIVGLYLFTDVLVLALGAYDYVTRRRLHPAYVIGVCWMLGIELIVQSLLHDEAWKQLSIRIVGLAGY